MRLEARGITKTFGENQALRGVTLALPEFQSLAIIGPSGAGKTSLIRHLLAHKPAHERWAVLINEFGQIGLDAALLAEVIETFVGFGEHGVAGGQAYTPRFYATPPGSG